MTLVNGIWYDNEIGSTKIWRQSGYRHEWELAPNDEGIEIVKCKKCKEARMWISTIEEKSCN